jgi:retron-type reverse transcriptase
MKRIGNIYSQITTFENLRLADARARKGKGYQYGVKEFDKNPDGNLLMLQETLINNYYKTSTYTTFPVWEPKERLIYSLPYYPDRITHHAIMNVMEPLFRSWFTNDTYSSIKGKGIKAAADNVKKALRDKPGTQYCLKLDIRKFYPSIDHDILKALLRKKIKDNALLGLLDEIIDSTDGVPIGNYLSQYFANFYLTYFDHWIKETLGVKYYFRYADDIVILSDSKEELHSNLAAIKQYLNDELRLQVKGNYQIFPVEKRGIDFVGYVFFHTYTLLRKSTKKRFAKAVSKTKKWATIAAYWGWAKGCDSKHLLKKLIPDEYKKLQGFQYKASA